MPKLKPLRIAVIPDIPVLPIFVADDQKLFQKYGLESQLTLLGPDKVAASMQGVASDLPILYFWKNKQVDIESCQKYADYLTESRVIRGRIDVLPMLYRCLQSCG
jgi:hypothetical protein